MSSTQQNREIEIITPLGADVLLLREVTVTEELGRLFSINVEMGSTQDISFEKLLGQNVSIRLNLAQGKRFFNGFVTSISQGVSEGRFARYYATIHPWLWFLTRTSDCRIFQNKTVPDIIKEILQEHGFSDIVNRLKGSYRTWDYCVQYRETDFNFISRLMEQEGIYYFFMHEPGKHTLYLADDMASHDKMADCYNISYYPPDQAVIREDECISGWNITKQLQTGTYCLNEYDFEHPKADLNVNSNVVRNHSKADLEVYDYPGEYVKSSDGSHYAKIRIQELHSQYERMQGHGNVRGLMCGGLFKLNLFPRSDQNREYLVTSVTHRIRIDSFESTASSSGNQYSNSFSVIESNVPYRIARLTPKPFVQGPQTAVVVGPSGEEIYTDKYGRVKVQFHWDRVGERNENSSCWIRVSNPWAGKGWGSVSIPRIGQEVIVDFLEGDPDQPIITGRVYNADQMPPYELPGSGMVSGMKSSTTPGGGGYNEISTNDTKGKEKITIHGQYDMNTTVQHDQTNTVNNKFTETIKSDASITITEGKYSHDVKANTANYHVKGALTENYDTTQDTTVKNNITITSTAGSIYLKAATKITLEVGASKITMDAAGKIAIEGINVVTNGTAMVTTKGGVVHSEADSEHQTKGAIVLSEGSATNTVKGGVVMLNP